MNETGMVAIFCDESHEEELKTKIKQLAGFPYRIFPLLNGPAMHRAVRIFSASCNDYCCALNLCTGTAEDEDRASPVILALLLEQMNVAYAGCRYMTLSQPLDILFMMCFYAGLSLPLFSVVKSEDDIDQLNLQFPVKIKNANPLQCAFESVVTEMSTLRKVLNEVLSSYDKVVVWEVNATKERELHVLVSGSGCVAIHQGGGYPKDDAWLQECTPSLEKYADAFAKLVINKYGFAKLSFNKSPHSDILVLEDVVLGCSLMDLDAELFSAAVSKRLLDECVRESREGWKSSVMEVRFGGPKRGYILCAARDLKRGELVFEDEGRSFSIVTRPFVEKHWGEEEKEMFAEYAWPLDADGHVYATWENDPRRWRPINHSCNPNCIFNEEHSLNVIAARDINKDEELTMDYLTFCDYTMKPFPCHCGAECCRGLIVPDEAALSKYGTNKWHRRLPIPPTTNL